MSKHNPTSPDSRNFVPAVDIGSYMGGRGLG